jgi:hypothetical protein
MLHLLTQNKSGKCCVIKKLFNAKTNLHRLLWKNFIKKNSK